MRNEFDLDPRLIYLNGGSHSICPRQVLEAVMASQRDFELNPTANLFDTWRRLWESQKALAVFLGARPGDLFLRANVTEAMNALILGMPLARGGEILSTDLEYGAITNLCRFRAERDGHAHRKMALPSTPEENAVLTEDTLLARILAELRPETRMLVVSHIVTGTGLKLPIRRLARETRARGVLLIVDGAHAPGAIPLDFKELEDVDGYGGNLHKWMMGPKGTGFGWLAPRHQDAIQPIFAGWTTFETYESFKLFGEGSRFQGKMLLSSSRDFSCFFAIPEMISFWNRLGASRILERITEFQELAENTVAQATGWARLSPPRELRGPLVTFRLPASLQAEGYGLMHRLLKDHGLQIVTAPVLGVYQLRLSPHIWNTREEIQRAGKILESLKTS